MKNKFIIYLSTIFFFLGYSSCSHSSMLMINKDYKEVKTFFGNGTSDSVKLSFDYYEKSDSLVVVSNWERNPFEAIFLFENDKCFYQEMNIYCSPCADKMVNDIIKEEKYKFVAIDPVNYISKTDEKIVLRLRDQLDDRGNCNKITILKTQ